ncbi:hypothetical protein D3C73_1325240 [compost metagenome]
MPLIHLVERVEGAAARAEKIDNRVVRRSEKQAAGLLKLSPDAEGKLGFVAGSESDDGERSSHGQLL